MRKKFLGYHKPIKEDLNRMWQEGIFVFDTSVLLNIYRYTSTTREDFFKILENIKDRVWLPYQVGFEYHEQRENVISRQNDIYDDLENINRVFQETISNKYKKGHPFADTKKIEQIIKDAVEKSKGVLKKAQSELSDLLEEDVHLEKLKILFDEKIGEPYSKEQQHKVYAEAQKRYEEKVPPGYMDSKNKDGSNAYGDVILWYQILDYATEHKTPIIFIIDDAKEDWWRQDKTKKILGPRPEIIQEFHEKTGKILYMYLADEFIQQAQQKLKIQIQPTTIKEVREIRQSHQTEKNESIANILMHIKEERQEISHRLRKTLIQRKYIVKELNSIDKKLLLIDDESKPPLQEQEMRAMIEKQEKMREELSIITDMLGVLRARENELHIREYNKHVQLQEEMDRRDGNKEDDNKQTTSYSSLELF